MPFLTPCPTPAIPLGLPWLSGSTDEALGMHLSHAADLKVLLPHLKATAASLVSYLPPALKPCSLAEVVVINDLFNKY